jgi:excisionase family DNA binding protein
VFPDEFGGTATPLPAKDERMSKKPDNVLTIDDLSAYLKVPKSSLYKLVQEGKLPGTKVGRHWRFRRETIDRWLDAGGQVEADLANRPG